MTLYGAISNLVMMREHPMMPSMFYSSLDKIIETVSECEELETNCSEFPNNWIPCSKETAPKSPLRVQIQLDNSWIITAYYDGEYWYAVPDIGDVIDGKHIEAWRELPEPYQPEEE